MGLLNVLIPGPLPQKMDTPGQWSIIDRMFTVMAGNGAQKNKLQRNKTPLATATTAPPNVHKCDAPRLLLPQTLSDSFLQFHEKLVHVLPALFPLLGSLGLPLKYLMCMCDMVLSHSQQLKLPKSKNLCQV